MDIKTNVDDLYIHIFPKNIPYQSHLIHQHQSCQSVKTFYKNSSEIHTTSTQQTTIEI